MESFRIMVTVRPCGAAVTIGQIPDTAMVDIGHHIAGLNSVISLRALRRQ